MRSPRSRRWRWTMAKTLLNLLGAKSVCTCGHTGDGPRSCHNGFNGHGPCAICDCEQFTWARWTDLAEGIVLLERKVANDPK
jgi:hypothetical protein